jgi:hypothetical protein
VRPATKALLIVEMIVCFGLPAPLLLVGAVMIPLQVRALLDEPLLWEGPAELIGQVVCGICGLLALRFVLSRLLAGAKSPIKYPGVLWVGVLLGLLPILGIAIRGSAGWKIFAAAPLLATLCRAEPYAARSPNYCRGLVARIRAQSSYRSSARCC